MSQEKVRVYVLARELNVESKDLLDMCRDAGMDVKNQLSSLEPEQAEAIKLLVKRGGKPGAAAPAAPVATAPLPTDIDRKIKVLPAARKAAGTQADVAVAVSPPVAAPD